MISDLEKEKRILRNKKLTRLSLMMIVPIITTVKIGENQSSNERYTSEVFGHYINQFSSLNFNGLDNPETEYNFETKDEAYVLGQSIELYGPWEITSDGNKYRRMLCKGTFSVDEINLITDALSNNDTEYVYNLIIGSKNFTVLYEYQDNIDASLEKEYFKAYIYELREDEIILVDSTEETKLLLSAFYGCVGILISYLVYNLVNALYKFSIEESKERIRELYTLELNEMFMQEVYEQEKNENMTRRKK